MRLAFVNGIMNDRATSLRRLKPAFSPLVGRRYVAGGFFPRRNGVLVPRLVKSLGAMVVYKSHMF